MTRQTEIRVLSVDDHRLYREGIATVIKNQPDMLLVGEAASSPEAVQQFRELQPDVTLLNVRMRNSIGMDALIAILSHFPEARVILVSTFEGDLATQRAQQAGAWGHILKTMHPREIVDAIRQVHAGRKTFLPTIASETASLAGAKRHSSGKSGARPDGEDNRRNREISERLRISEDTMKNHFDQIMLTGRSQSKQCASHVGAPRIYPIVKPA